MGWLTTPFRPCTVTVFALVSLALAVPAPAQTGTAFTAKYCVGCHNQRTRTAGVALEGVNPSAPAAQAELWEKALIKLRSETMPPPGAPKPDAAARRAFVADLENGLDRAAEARPNAGTTTIHRLNRNEYGNAIRDLLALDVDPAVYLPADDSGYGFDNIADVLSVSPMLTERYLSAARKISRLAMGDTTMRPSTEVYAVGKLFRQDDRMSESLPFASRGGISVHTWLPVDGEYTAKLYLLRTYDGRIRGLNQKRQLDVRLNGELLRTIPVGSEVAPGASAGQRNTQEDGIEVRFPGKAGPANIEIYFQKETAVREGMLRPDYPITSYEYAGDATVPPGLGNVEISGPYAVRGPGNSPSRQRILICKPEGQPEACAERIIGNLLRRAWRRPVSAHEVEAVMPFYRQGEKQNGFDSGIGMALQRILVSPEFLFRAEHTPTGAVAGKPYPVSDVELASRLSFFLWSSLPDDELLSAAEKGRLRNTDVLEQQAARMLDDKRSAALMTNFTGQWLYLRNIGISPVDAYAFPDFDDNLREAFARELELFLDSEFRDNQPVSHLLDADYTFVNERLARHYGISGVHGSHFRRVHLADEARRGLLGKGGILMVTSYADRTSPVKRGKWLLENIMGAPPPPPPPNVPALKANVTGQQAQSVRERLEEHRQNPACSGCHKMMDPLGFALENFDATGHWRSNTEAGTPVDASGQLIDGMQISGPVGLRNALLTHREDFARTLTRKLLTYALGRGVEYYDEPAVRKIVRDAAPGGYRWRDLVLGIIRSRPFQMRTAPADTVAAVRAPNGIH